MHSSARGPLFEASPPKGVNNEDANPRRQQQPPRAPGSAPHRLQPLLHAADAGDASGEGIKNGGIQLRQRTVLEQRKMATISERQLTNRHQKQVVQRREYKGAGFALKPATATFDNFTVGAEHRCTIDLTNVSYTFNSFKVEALPPQLRAVLEMQYVPQSRMVAGKQAAITVVFTPKEPVDVEGVITISTQTGVMELPVICRTKRSKVVASTKVIDFGSVVVAESSSQQVTIRNEGALPTKLSIEGDALQLFLIEHTMVQASAGGARRAEGSMTVLSSVDEDAATDAASLVSGGSNANLRQGLTSSSGRGGGGGTSADTPIPFAMTVDNRSAAGQSSKQQHASSSSSLSQQGSVRTCRILSSDPDLAGAAATGKPHTLRLAPFSETTITFNFTPLEICAFQSSLFLHLHDADSDDMVLFVKGESVAVPVFISENSTVDFLSTYYETLYRETFTVTNNTNATVKVSPLAPGPLRGTGVVEFIPKFGFVQPHSALSFQVKFQPVESVMSASALKLRSGTASTGAAASAASGGSSVGGAGILKFEELVEVRVSDQAMPLFVRLVAAVSTRSLRFADPADGEVRLGAVYVDERSEVVVLLSNLAGVHRTAAFLQVPSNIDILEPLPLPSSSSCEEQPATTTTQLNGSTQMVVAASAKRAARRTHMFQLLPLETLRVRLSIAVPGGSVGAFTQQLRVLTEHDDHASLTITGQGRAPLLQLTPASVWFPPCAVGTNVETVVQLKNLNGGLVMGGGGDAPNSTKVASASSGVLSFDFMLLRRHGVQVTPQSGVLGPGESIPVRVRFNCTPQVVNLSMPPPIDTAAELAKLVAQEEEAAAAEAATMEGRGKTPDKKVAKKRSKAEEELDVIEKHQKDMARREHVEGLRRLREQEINQLKRLIPWDRTPPQQQGSGAEPWALFRTFLIPCMFKQGGGGSSPSSGVASVPGGGSSNSSSSGSALKPIFLEVRCTVVKPTLTVRSDDAPSVGERLVQPPRLTAAALTQPSKANTASQQQQSGEKGSPGKATLNVPIGKSGRTKSAQSLGNNSAGTKKSGASANGQNSAVVAEEERLMAEQLRAQLEAAEDDARRREAELKSSLTPVTSLDFGSVPSQHAVTKTFTIYHERFPAKIQRFIQEHLFSRTTAAQPAAAVDANSSQQQHTVEGGGGAGPSNPTSDPPTTSAPSDEIARVSSAGSKPPLPTKATMEADANTAKAKELLRSLPSMCLTVRPLEIGGVFNVSRPPLPILRPFQSTEVSITFEPRQDAHYRQSLEIVCDVEQHQSPSSSLDSTFGAIPHVRQYTLTAHLNGRGKPAALRILKSGRRQASADAGDGGGGGSRAGGGKKGASNNKGSALDAHRTSTSVKMDLTGLRGVGDGGGEGEGGVHETPEPEVVVGDFGTCCSGDVLEQYFDLGNCSDFPLKVNTLPVTQINRNSNGTSPFWVADAASQIVVPPRSATTIRLCFTPSVVGSFGCDMRVSYGGAGAFHTLRLQGSCAERPVYVVPPFNPNAVGLISSPTTADGDAAAVEGTITTAKAGDSAAGGDEDREEISLGRLAVAHTPPPTRRAILGDALCALPTATIARPGSSPHNPLVLTFTTTAIRDYKTSQAAFPDMNYDTLPSPKDNNTATSSPRSPRKAAPATTTSSTAADTARGKKGKGRNGGEDMLSAADYLPKYSVISSTATHRFVVGTSRASTNRGEFAVVGLSAEAVAAGWKCTVAGFGSSCGESPVAGEVAQPGASGGSGLAGPIGAVFGPLLGNTHQQTGAAPSSSSSAKADLPTSSGAGGASSQGGMLVRGVIPPKSAAVVEISFTPSAQVLESLPLEGVDITNVVMVKFLTKGGGTGPIIPVTNGAVVGSAGAGGGVPSSSSPSSLQRRGSSQNMTGSTPRNHQQQQQDHGNNSINGALSGVGPHGFGDIFGYLDAEGTQLSQQDASTAMGTPTVQLGADGAVLFIQLKAVVKCTPSS